MAYYCSDCTYTGKASATSGTCPACGSSKFSLKRAGGEDETNPDNRRYGLLLVIAIWVYLAGHILWKLLSS
jgi:hypothetical protein